MTITIPLGKASTPPQRDHVSKTPHLRHTHRAFTLIETLAVVVVVGLLAALVLVAIQRGREAARRTQCANNLKQLGIAIHNYAATHNYLPPGTYRSFYIPILPNLDDLSLFNAYNFSGNFYANITVLRTKIDLFVCTSDSKFPTVGSFTNYAGNMGDGRSVGIFNGPITTASITDGTSNTAMVSEWLVGRPGVIDPMRTLYHVNTNYEPEFVVQCTSLQGVPAPTGNLKGEDWTTGALFKTLYDHFLPINAPSCSGGQGADVMLNCTAASQHPRGANSLFADSSVHFVQASVDRMTWRALGTRQGNDLASPGSF